ncbi:MAG: DUF7453 family protein [Planctomycetota bacterium]|jgi:hypothetical protein
MRRSTNTAPFAAAAALGVGGPLTAGTIEAIYTNIPGHPTAQVPGVPGEQFRSPLVPFLTLHGSPTGTHWIFKAFTDNPSSEANDVIVTGSGTVGTVVAKEGNPAPIEGLTYGFMDSDCGVNDSGRYVFGNRLSGGSTETDEILLVFNGTEIVSAVREGDEAPGLVDPNGAGNELFGNSLNSAHVLGDGTVAFKADLIQNIHSDFESALYQGLTVVAQEGTPIGSAAGIDIYDGFVGLGGNTFSSSADGGSWIVEADVLPDVGTEEAVVVNGNIVIRDGDFLGNLPSPVDAVFAVDMAANGDWFARGDLADDDVWAVRNGLVIAATGRPITSDEPEEVFTDSILAVNGNAGGDYIVIGTTSNPDPALSEVAVLNGDSVIARAGDAVDLGGEEPPEAFIEGFAANDAFLSDDFNDDTVDDRELYVFARIRDGQGQTLGDAFLVVRLAAPCPWDCQVAPNGSVGIADLLALLAQWGGPGACDFNGGGVGISDLLTLLANWGLCP